MPFWALTTKASVSGMSHYAFQFSWPGGFEDDINIGLDAETSELAKEQAVVLFAGAQFKRTPPTGFRILQDGTEVYRFPPPAYH